MRLVHLAGKCKFVWHFENVLRDKFVCGLVKGSVFHKVSELGPMATFQDCVTVAIETEVAIKKRLKSTTRKSSNFQKYYEAFNQKKIDKTN